MSKLTVNAGETLANYDPFCAWLRVHDIQPEITWRVMITDDSITVYQYAVGDDGAVKTDGGETVRRQPYKVQIREDLPEEIWTGAY
jgi:hypothetical protein